MADDDAVKRGWDAARRVYFGHREKLLKFFLGQ